MEKLFVIVLMYLLSTLSLAQDSKYKVILKGGITSYSGVQGFVVSGGGGDGIWKIGPVGGVGTEYDLGKSWFAQGTLEYSYSIFGDEVHHSESLERGHNTVIEVMGNIKKKWNWFYLITGVGYSTQNSTDTYKSGFINGERFHYVYYKGTSTNILTGLLGIGLEFNIVDDLGIFMEGSWRLRKYVSSITEIGVLYRL